MAPPICSKALDIVLGRVGLPTDVIRNIGSFLSSTIFASWLPEDIIRRLTTRDIARNPRISAFLGPNFECQPQWVTTYLLANPSTFLRALHNLIPPNKHAYLLECEDIMRCPLPELIQIYREQSRAVSFPVDSCLGIASNPCAPLDLLLTLSSRTVERFMKNPQSIPFIANVMAERCRKAQFYLSEFNVTNRQEALNMMMIQVASGRFTLAELPYGNTFQAAADQFWEENQARIDPEHKRIDLQSIPMCNGLIKNPALPDLLRAIPDLIPQILNSPEASRRSDLNQFHNDHVCRIQWEEAGENPGYAKQIGDKIHTAYTEFIKLLQVNIQHIMLRSAEGKYLLDQRRIKLLIESADKRLTNGLYRIYAQWLKKDSALERDIKAVLDEANAKMPRLREILQCVCARIEAIMRTAFHTIEARLLMMTHRPIKLLAYFINPNANELLLLRLSELFGTNVHYPELMFANPAAWMAIKYLIINHYSEVSFKYLSRNPKIFEDRVILGCVKRFTGSNLITKYDRKADAHAALSVAIQPPPVHEAPRRSERIAKKMRTA